ncbi:MAG: squalene/phytoene synthase family protein [Paracoccus sp. (in: a-proteobacteria)]
MTPDHCVALLRESDPDRFASVMAAKPGDRARLATLYAANLEIACAAVASAEPLISEMRLQWWADQIAVMADGQAPVSHEVASPLFEVWGRDIFPLSALIDARRYDALREPFQDDTALLSYIHNCTGTVMRLAAGACGFEDNPDLVDNQALGAGLARWLGAYPQLRSMNMGLMPESPERLAVLAETGLKALDSVAAITPAPPRRAAAALYAGAGARRILRAIIRGRHPEVSHFRRNLSYASLAFLGHWRG